jgi:osmotically-inducible protein OsmY
MKTVNTDTDLQHDILAELEWDPSINAAEVGVSVHQGVVTLTGYVDSYSEKVAAVKAAKRVFGVKAVANEVHVRIPGVSARTDTDIARAALSALKWTASVANEPITVTVNNGRVLLEGEVKWQYQKSAAERAVRDLLGVTGLNNSITIKARPKPQDIQHKIESAFQRNAELDARAIRVQSVDGTVTLVGTVHSFFEREQAERAAWAAPGVLNVENQIAVNP